MKWVGVMLFLLAQAVYAGGSTNIFLRTSDDVEIAATYYPASSDAKSPAIILIHEAGRTREIWAPLAALLQENGIAALAIDLRGHGESIRRLAANGPMRVDLQSFTQHDYQDMLLDLNAAFDWLNGQPGVDADRVALLGSVLGANLALRYALFNEDIAALVLLSPVIDYQGLKADEAMDRLGPVPFRIVTSAGDNIPFASAKKLIELRQKAGGKLDGKELIASTGTLRGTDLLRGVSDLTPQIVNWLKDRLRAPTP